MSHKRSVEDKRRLKRLSKKSRWWRGAYYSDIKDRYFRLYTSDWGGNKRVRWLKRYCNKRIRRHPDLIQRGQFHKYSDFRWDLF